MQSTGNFDLALDEVTYLLRERHGINNPKNDTKKDDFQVRTSAQANDILSGVPLGCDGARMRNDREISNVFHQSAARIESIKSSDLTRDQRVQAPHLPARTIAASARQPPHATLGSLEHTR
jgi:hypothetical protein